jgi:hypothetical protein
VDKYLKTVDKFEEFVEKAGSLTKSFLKER